MKKTKRKNGQKGITLIALIITSIVLIILAGISIMMISGQDGILTRAGSTKIQSELAEYKEQIDLFIISKKMENIEFDEESFFAGEKSLRYNTKIESEEENIKTICPQMKDSYLGKIEVKKGKMTLNTKDKIEIKIAQSLGIDVNPYEITEDGELVASSGNLLLIDSKGTLTLPDSVIIIGEGAFANTQSDGITLKKIIIPSTVKKIKANAFNGNSTIEEVEIQTKNGEGVTTIGELAFANCSNLKSVVLPDTVKYMGSHVFDYCRSLKNVQLSNNMSRIESYMFCGCSGLEEINLAENIDTIGACAFYNCINLKKILFSDKLQTIDSGIFSGCSKLEEIELGKNTNFIFENGILMNSNKTFMYYVTNLASNVKTFKVPNGVIKLLGGTLKSTEIKNIEIPASVNYISYDFFPSSVENVKIDTENKSYITDNGMIYSIDKKSLYYCFTKDITISISDETEIIEAGAFCESKAKIINFTDNIKEVKKSAFWDNTYITEINLNNKLSSIAPTAFTATNANVKFIGNNDYFVIENGLIYTKDKTSLVACTKQIAQIDIPNGVKEIGNEVFRGRTTITKITLPQTLNKIGNMAFSYCYGLTEIEIPDSVTEIGSGCFLETPNLKKIKINKPEGSILGKPWGSIYGDRAIIWKE